MTSMNPEELIAEIEAAPVSIRGNITVPVENMRTLIAAYRAMADRAEKAEAERDELAKALGKLEREASEVSRQGAVTGRQWTLMAGALIYARAALSRIKESNNGTATSKGVDHD